MAAAKPIDRRLFFKLAFFLAVLFTIGIAARFLWRLRQFRLHAGEAPQGWMPIRYVARLHGVDLDALRAALGLPAGQRDRRTIAEIAAERGLAVEIFLAEVAAALDSLKATPAP